MYSPDIDWGTRATSTPTSEPVATTTPLGDSGISTIDKDWAMEDPRAAQAAITRQQWEYSRKTFLPIEDRLISRVSADIEPEADKAGATAAASFQTSRGEFQRDLSRRGTRLTAAQNEALVRRRAISESKGIATAENLTRRSLEDRNRNLQASLAGLGKGIATSSEAAFGTAANAQAQREATGKALKAQQKASKTGGAASGAAIGMQYGWWGAAAGAVIGYVTG